MAKYIDEFSCEERARIDAEFKRFGNNVYLDHAGTTLYADSQVANAAHTLQRNVYCNPHTCRATGDLVDQVRYKVLDFFNTNSDEYAVIFTANATAALKLVAECFRFENDDKSSQGNFYYCQDNHTSVLGMRAVVRSKEMYALSKEDLLENLKAQPSINGNHDGGDAIDAAMGNSLITFSAQCNFSGYKLPLALIAHIQRHGLARTGMPAAQRSEDEGVATHKHNNFVCLDAAAYVSTSFLNLDEYKPDFVCLSFYKMFGYPTGVGALLVHRRAEKLLEKRFYGGGTIDFAFADFAQGQKYRDCFYTRFEDGTLPFLSIVGLLEGYRTLERLVPATEEKRSIERISVYVHQLAKYCYDELASLKHTNGAPVVRLYNYAGYEQRALQGGVVTFNVLNDIGTYVGYAELACMAALHNIMLRTGCFCNLGACKSYLQLSDSTVLAQFQAGRVCGDYMDLIDEHPTGAVRVSFNYMTRYSDVQQLVRMIRDCYVTVRAGERLRILQSDVERLPPALQHIPTQLRPKVRCLSIYPVKSCAAYKIETSWPVTEKGFAYDRQWMVVDANGMAVTQKHHRRLCIIRPRVLLERKELELTFEGRPNICVPLELPSNANMQRCKTKVCKTPIEGQDCGDEVADWLANCLETDGLRFIQQTNTRRTVSGVTKELSFANQGQFLIINVASVRWLASKLQVKREHLETTIDRFRGNIIVESKAPFDENDYRELTINGIKLRVDGACTRCEMICIDQDTGEQSPELLRTLAREFGGKIAFGVYVSLVANQVKPESSIKCGDYITVTRT